MKHTPGPWKWGDGWKELLADPPKPGVEYSGPKYADTQLYGANGEEILPIRRDHYEDIWDSANGFLDLKPADRALIVSAPDLLDVAVRMLNHAQLKSEFPVLLLQDAEAAIKKARGVA